MTAKPHFASSCGVGRVARISSLCQLSAIKRLSSVLFASRFNESPVAMLALNEVSMASYFWIIVRRNTSVG